MITGENKKLVKSNQAIHTKKKKEKKKWIEHWNQVLRVEAAPWIAAM